MKLFKAANFIMGERSDCEKFSIRKESSVSDVFVCCNGLPLFVNIQSHFLPRYLHASLPCHLYVDTQAINVIGYSPTLPSENVLPSKCTGHKKASWQNGVCTNKKGVIQVKRTTLDVEMTTWPSKIPSPQREMHPQLPWSSAYYVRVIQGSSWL